MGMGQARPAVTLDVAVLVSPAGDSTYPGSAGPWHTQLQQEPPSESEP